jgi:Protein of unknown function (DUF2605)
MLPADFSDPELLKGLLAPLLDDFEFWFERSATLLSEESLLGTSREDQAALLARVEQAHQELRAVRSLFSITDGQAGVDTSLLLIWHKLVTECWQVASLHRQLQSPKSAP